MKPGSLLLALAGLISFSSMVAAAGPMADLAGHYHYDEYRVSLPNGRVLALKDLGATDAFLDIADSGTITLRMTMKAGNTVTETAKVTEFHVSHGTGYWVAQWPDMKTPVRAKITISGNTLTSDTTFDDKSDAERYGSIEHAVLRRVSDR